MSVANGKEVRGKAAKAAPSQDQEQQRQSSPNLVQSACKCTCQRPMAIKTGSTVAQLRSVASPTQANSSGVIQRATIQPSSPGSITLNPPTDSTAQLRSTLAIGQLIASNRPTAGSRLIANELKHLSKTVEEQSASLRNEIASLSSNLSKTLKTVMDDEREQRSLSSVSALTPRRPMFSHFSARRFPVYRRPRRMPLQFARKSLANASTSTSSATPGSSSTSSSTSTTAAQDSPSGNSAQKAPQLGAKMSTAATSAAALRSPETIKTLQAMFKNPWLPNERSATSYDGEADTDSTDTTPSSSP